MKKPKDVISHNEAKPARLVGKVKWFGGGSRDLDYGFVQVRGGEDLFVHAQQCRCDRGRLIEGTAVTFTAAQNARTGKAEARSLLLLEEEQDETIIYRCLKDQDVAYVAPAWAASLRLVPPIVTLVARENCSEAIVSAARRYVDRLPSSVLALPEAEWLRNMLSRDDHIQICLLMIREESEIEEPPSHVFEELARAIFSRVDGDGSLSGKDPDGALKWPEMPKAVMMNRQFQACVAEQLKMLPEDEPKGPELVRQVRRCAWEPLGILAPSLRRETSPNLRSALTRDLAARKMPLSLKTELVVFREVTTVDQVETWCKQGEQDVAPTWSGLSSAAQSMALYRAVAEAAPQGRIAGLPCEQIEPIIIQSLIGGSQDCTKQPVFLMAHERLQQYVVERAWSSPAPIRLDTLLPACPFQASKVRYCEGRAWFQEHDKQTGASTASLAYCPRRGKECALNDGYPITGARIYPDTALPWRAWSLAELLQRLGITPELAELQKPEEYLPRLAGWINRLNDIRERLKCSVCHEMMIPNYAYAKNLARYNVTVVSCKTGKGHDSNIYINHCWGCAAVIDSRESRIKVEKFYICIHCGSGPQQSQSYSQGQVCPACGHRGMDLDDHDKRLCTCRSCRHRIRLPPAHRRTGRSSFEP